MERRDFIKKIGLFMIFAPTTIKPEWKKIITPKHEEFATLMFPIIKKIAPNMPSLDSIISAQDMRENPFLTLSEKSIPMFAKSVMMVNGEYQEVYQEL